MGQILAGEFSALKTGERYETVTLPNLALRPALLQVNPKYRESRPRPILAIHLVGTLTHLCRYSRYPRQTEARQG